MMMVVVVVVVVAMCTLLGNAGQSF